MIASWRTEPSTTSASTVPPRMGPKLPCTPPGWPATTGSSSVPSAVGRGAGAYRSAPSRRSCAAPPEANRSRCRGRPTPQREYGCGLSGSTPRRARSRARSLRPTPPLPDSRRARAEAATFVAALSAAPSGVGACRSRPFGGREAAAIEAGVMGLTPQGEARAVHRACHGQHTVEVIELVLQELR